MSSNRMFVANGQSHITEERLIEDKMQTGIVKLKKLTAELDEYLYDHKWESAGSTARNIGCITDYMARMEYRLHDVVQINAQFERIQEHIDRIEATEKQDVSYHT